MQTEVLLPQVELTMEQVLVAKWLIDVGSYVEAEQPLVEIETQKATTEVPSPRAGYVRQLCVQEGDAIGASAVLCIVTDTADEPLDDRAQAVGRRDADGSPARTDAAGPAHSGGSIVPATPAARRVAKELGLDLQTLRGTGPGGRVTEDDVRSAAPGQPPADWKPLSAARMALIEQMSEAGAPVPQIEVFRQLDVRSLLASAEGITFTHRLIVAAAVALRQHPALRTVLKDNQTKIEPVSVAVAMDTAHGLVAPVVRMADALSLQQVAGAVIDLRRRAQAGTLRRQELTDAPFAITNLGMLEVDFFRPLVFRSQTAVLAVGRANDAGLAWMALAVDHRIVDGAEAARFLQTLQAEIRKS